MNSRRSLLVLVAVALSLPLPALGQQAYEPSDVLDRGFQSRVLAVGEQVKADNQAAWRNAHNGSEPSGTEFVRRWALVLRAQGYTVCVNGKRGSETLSQDVLAFPVTNGWARDTSGKYRGRIMVVDVIGGAGGSNPSLLFGPDTSGADGRCIDPALAPGESGGTGGNGGWTTTPPVVTPPIVVTPPAPPVDLSPITAALARIEARLDTLERLAADGDPALVKSFIDDMVGQGPGGDPDVTPNHVTDILQRIDKQRALIDELSRWLRSRRALGF